MDKASIDALQEALLTTTALKQSMEHALRSDPNAVWPHTAYRLYMRKYNDVVAYVRTLVKITAPIDTYNLDKVPTSGNTVMPVQKELFARNRGQTTFFHSFRTSGSR